MALGLQAILLDHHDFAVELSSSRDEAVQLLRDTQPEMLLLDLHSDFNLGFLQEVRKICPSCKVVLWVDSISTETAYQAFSMGVRGILQKLLYPEAFLLHLRSIRDGNLWIEKNLMNSIASAKTVSLTRREAQLVSLLAQALKNKEIAWALNVTENTVKAYLSRLFQKLGVKDRLELALYGLKNLNGSQNWAQVENGTFHFADRDAKGDRSFQSILLQPDMRPNGFPSTPQSPRL